MDPSHAPRFKEPDLERKASEALKNAYPHGVDIPVDIDLLAQSHPLVDDIIPAELLEDKFGVAAVLSVKSNGRVDILIDEDTYLKQPARANFSIAHEFGHIVLHPKVWQPCRTMNDVLAIQERISSVYSHMEWSANYFAAAILIPRARLSRHVADLYEGLVRIYGFREPELILHKLWTMLARQYHVTVKPMRIRLAEVNIADKVNAALREASPVLEF